MRVCERPPTAICPRLRQVLTNLIGNAIKFTERGHVTMRVSQEQSTVWRFEVTDSGIGIAANETDLVFDAVAQADGTHSRRFGGTGLGLAISKQLVELMGGTIGVSSTHDVGSTFAVTIPFEAAHKAGDRRDSSTCWGGCDIARPDYCTHRKHDCG